MYALWPVKIWLPPPLLRSTLGRSWANHELLQQGYSAGTGRHRHPPVPVLLREEQKRVARRRGRLVVGRRVRLGRVRAGRALRIRGGRCGGRRRRRVVADGLRHLGQPVRGPLEAALRRPLVPARTSTGISDPSVEAETRTIGLPRRAAPPDRRVVRRLVRRRRQQQRLVEPAQVEGRAVAALVGGLGVVVLRPGRVRLEVALRLLVHVPQGGLGAPVLPPRGLLEEEARGPPVRPLPEEAVVEHAP